MARSVLRTSLGASALALALLLSACAGSPGASTPTPTASVASSEPAPSPSADVPSPPVTLPTDCSTLATEPTRAEAIGDLTLQSNGEGFVRPAPENAQLALGCDWIVGDATGMLLLISTADPAAITAAVQTLPAQGYTCQVSDDFGADFCDLPGAGPDTEEMIVARDDVWIYLSTVNRNGRAFLSEIAQGVFG
ncbi:hypothetical protein ACTU3I_15450 [Microbacterium sp. RD1]|uniref:hypothetical protein n=1 Tax=Microbacterium sp. RD1 TaxID=3457313 RepID=UPI003FA5B8FB